MDKAITRFGKKASSTSRHLWRYALHQAGLGVEQIASDESVSKATIEKSIAMVEAFKMANTMDMLKPAMIDTLLGRKDKVDTALDEALSAKITGKGGVSVPDHDRRLKAVTEYRELAKVAQPKVIAGRGASVVLHNTQQSAVVAPMTGGPRFEGFEERLRVVRQKVDQHNQLPPPESVAAPLGEDELSLEDEDADVDPGNTSG